MEKYEGWAADPTGEHEARYFLEGRPTPLVRDGEDESFDALLEAPAPSSLTFPGSPAPTAAGPTAPPPPAAGPTGTPPPETGAPPGGPPPPAENPAGPVAPPPPSATAPSWRPAPPTSWGSRSDSPPAWTAPGATGGGASAPPQWPATSGFGPTGPDSFTLGGAPAPRSRKRLATSLVAVVMAAVVASVAIVVLTGGTKKSAQAVVVDSVTSTLADRTAHVTMAITSHTPSGAVSLSGNGVIDFGQNAMQMTMNTDAGGNAVQLHVMYLAGVVYENVPGLSQLIPGKSWISLDLSSLAQAAGKDPGADPSALTTGSNPAAILRLLGEHGNHVVPLGPSTVDGVSVQGYSVTLNPAAIQAEIAGAHLPAWMQSLVSQVNLSDATVRVYVDGSGLLRRFAMALNVSAASLGTTSVGESLDFSDYGAPVSITAPPPGDVASFEQFLQAAQSALGSGGSPGAGGTPSS